MDRGRPVPQRASTATDDARHRAIQSSRARSAAPRVGSATTNRTAASSSCGRRRDTGASSAIVGNLGPRPRSEHDRRRGRRRRGARQPRERALAVPEAAAGERAQIEHVVDLVLRHEAVLDHEGADALAGLGRLLDQLRDPLVAEDRVERGRGLRGGLGVGAAPLDVGLEPGDAASRRTARRPTASSRIDSSRLRAITGRYTLSSKLPCEPAKAMAASLPMTWAHTWVTASGITGFTLPGMIELPGCRSGRRISASPVLGPAAHPAEVVGDLDERHGEHPQVAREPDQLVAGALGGEVVGRLRQRAGPCRRRTGRRPLRRSRPAR